MLNLEDSVALAQNVVSERNLLAVSDFLEVAARRERDREKQR